MRVFKYNLSEALNATEDGTVFIHGKSPKAVHVGPDPSTGVLCLWAEVDETQPPQAHNCRICGTGHPSPPVGEYSHLGTAICGPFVWHVYSRTLSRRQ